MSESLCSLYDQRVHIINDTLYFVGGSYLDTSGIKPSSARRLSKLDLSKSVQVDGLIKQNLIETEAAPDEITDKDATGGTFFYDDRSLWAYGAVQGPKIANHDNETDMMYRYDTVDKAWTTDKIAGGAYGWFNNTQGFYATAPDGRSWYGGGFGIGTWARRPGLILFEGNETTPRWSFLPENKDVNSFPTPSTVGGTSVYLPIGDQGIIVLLGGYDSTKEGTQFAAGIDWDYRPMSDIFVYDIARNFWTLIEATGDLPNFRSEFCLVVNSSPEGSFHNVILYGGWNQLAGRAYADVWVLSLPSFRWVKAADENNPDTQPSKNDLNNPKLGDIGRTRHKCNVYKNNQMIVTGGIVSQYSDIKLNIDACNASHPPIMVMDTSSFVWKASITPEEQEYEVPDFIRTAVRSRREPDGGWPNDRLAAIFSAAVSPTSTTSGTAPTSTSSSPPTSSESSAPTDGLSTGGIAGIVVGAVVILVLSIAGFIFLRRWRRQTKPILPGPYGNGEAWQKAELPTDTPQHELPNNIVRLELTEGLRNPGPGPDRFHSPVELPAMSEHASDSMLMPKAT